MSQLASFETVIYGELQLVFVLILSYFLYATVKNGSKAGERINKYIIALFAMAIASPISDFAVRFLRESGSINRAAMCVLLIFMYVTNRMVPALWVLFAETKTNGEIGKKLSSRIAIFMPAIVNILLTISSPWTNLVFSMSETGAYSRGKLYIIGTICDLVYYATEHVLAVMRRRRATEKHERQINLAYAMFTLPALAGIIIQYFTRYPFRAIGYTISLALVYENIIRSNQKRNLSLIYGLTDDFNCVFLVDADNDTSRVIRMTKRFRGIFNVNDEVHSYSEAIAKNINAHVPSQDRERVLKEFESGRIISMLKSKKSYSVTYKIEIPDGSQIYNRAKFVKVNLDGGNYFILGLRDNDAEIRNEMYQVADNRAKEDLVSVLSDDYQELFLYNFENDYIIAEYNNNTKGKQRVTAEATGNPDFDYTTYVNTRVHPEDKKLLTFVQDKEALREALLRRKRKSAIFRQGTEEDYVYVELIVAKAEQVFEPPVNVAIAFKEIDASYREKLEQSRRLSEALEQADAANKAKSTFLFSISHDIRTPMNAIIGFTDIARKNLDNDKKLAECLEKIDIAGKHLLGLINNVLDLSSIESGKLQSDMRVIDFSKYGATIESVCKSMAEEKGLSFELVRDNLTPGFVSVDALHLNEILMNICNNAIKYTESGGKIIISISEAECEQMDYARYVFTVEDTGIGMSKNFLDNIFDPFTRESNSTISGIQGTGLGMAIVKRLVEYMNGSISIDSELGRGTKVTTAFNFKRVYNYSEEVIHIDETVDLSKKRILVVEDSEINREIVNAILAEEKITVENVENGRAAVDIVVEKGLDYYDCILMDIRMPVMDGYEATKAIRALEGADRLPIIALSANAFAEDKRKSLSVGMNGHIAKPIDVKELFDTLKRAMV